MVKLFPALGKTVLRFFSFSEPLRSQGLALVPGNTVFLFSVFQFSQTVLRGMAVGKRTRQEEEEEEEVKGLLLLLLFGSMIL